MARIVPAKPKLRIQAQKDLLWQLQDALPDDFIIFQNKPVAGGCILMNPGMAAIFLYLLPPTSTFNSDTWSVEHEDASEEEIDELSEKASEMLSDAGLSLGGVAILGAQVKPQKMSIDLVDGDLPLVCFQEAVAAAEEISFPGTITITDIEGFLSATAPGSSSYEPGTVTEAQLSLRKKKPVAYAQAAPEADAGPEEIDRDNGEPNKAVVAEEVDEVGVDNTILEDVPEGIEHRVPLTTKPVKLPPPAVPFHLNLSSSKRVIHLERMIEGYLETMRRERPLYSFGVDVEPDFVASADGMLPALLIAASEEWTPIVVATKGHAGFDIRMAKDPEALIGFRIIDVLVSTPSVLYMPLAHMLRKCFDGEGYVLDSIIERFGRWIEKYGFENEEIDDIGMHIALRALEGDD